MNKSKPYKQFTDAIGHLDFNKSKIFIFFGSCDYLIERGVQKFQSQATKNLVSCESLDASAMDLPSFEALWQQDSLFGDQTAYVLRRTESAKKLPNWIRQIPSANDNTNLVCMSYSGKTLTKPMAEACKHVEAVLIPCHNPLVFETKQFVNDLCQEKKLRLTEEAKAYLIDAIGHELFSIHNEVEKLSFVVEQDHKSLSKEDIKPHVGTQHVDHIFKLEDLILRRSLHEATALVMMLLDKGESPLAITGYLANIMRKSLKIFSLKQSGSHDRQIAQSLRIPPRAIENYSRFLQKTNSRHLIKQLAQCQDIDCQLKSTSNSPHTLLSTWILDTI